MQWNVDGAFVGVLESALPSLPADQDDDQSLLYLTFLAIRLLPSGPLYKEEKFSSNTEVGKNSGTIGHAIDAYAHHIVIDSLSTVMFADLQGMRWYLHCDIVININDRDHWPWLHCCAI